ncbi:response regulator transcription factor [Phenylobacterium sp.]|jgi:DNA-binding response OmpR family regulator|uniref:response regulator transcription factor n=1 Tax=Phenylobacterium sp. TaxID=1871053 RepID=UPI002E377DAE|nr:response regulator [Phenylobacterium sp.]HEX3365515.1 response regulator [Phenylobacterium sp.]
MGIAATSLPIDDEAIFVGRLAAKPRTALVVDGDPLVVRSLALMLGAEAFLVETAAGGADGIRLALAGAFDVIILGADLPDMSGLEAINRLRRAKVTGAVVFASVTPATAASAASLHLSDCS